jgi:hypothetical protein
LCVGTTFVAPLFCLSGKLILVSPAQSFLVPSPAGLMAIFSYLRFETPPTWRARSLYLCPPSDRVAQLYPQAPGSLFVAFYGSQGYDGGILTRLHTGNLPHVVKRPRREAKHPHPSSAEVKNGAMPPFLPNIFMT